MTRATCYASAWCAWPNARAAKNAVTGLLAQYNVGTPAALPTLPRFQCELHAEQRALLTAQIKRLERELRPSLVPDADVQRLLWIPGIAKTVAFTLHLEIDGIARFRDVRAFFSYCRLVPGAKNSGGKSRHTRTNDGNRYLKLAFSHAAVRTSSRSSSHTTARSRGRPSVVRRHRRGPGSRAPPPHWTRRALADDRERHDRRRL